MINITVPKKIINYDYHGPKTMEIPKIGLLQYKLTKDITDPQLALTIILNTVKKNMSKAERDLASLHLLAFNGKMLDTVVKDGFEYKLDNVYISQKLKFKINDTEFKFRSPSVEECADSVDVMLRKCCTKITPPQDIPDFLDMPAYVMDWAEKILNTVSIDGPSGPITGLNDLMELFNAELK